MLYNKATAGQLAAGRLGGVVVCSASVVSMCVYYVCTYIHVCAAHVGH